MLLQEAAYHQFHPGPPLDKPSERYVLPGMVKTIRKTPQVIDDIEHQIVVRARSPVKSG